MSKLALLAALALAACSKQDDCALAVAKIASSDAWSKAGGSGYGNADRMKRGIEKCHASVAKDPDRAKATLACLIALPDAPTDVQIAGCPPFEKIPVRRSTHDRRPETVGSDHTP
jgi:hypothetical protein